MKVLFAVVALALCLSATASPMEEETYQTLFTAFIKQHNKVYWSPEEFFTRYNVFKANLDIILKHEAQEGNTFHMKMNQFGDLTNAEFVTKYNRYQRRALRPNTSTISTVDTTNLPSSVDWPSKGVVTAVKNQGQCGSCWAFSTTGSIESIKAIKTGKLESLSEQELVDCSGSYGNEGCSGGEMQAAFQFVKANGGLCSESAYPYQAVDGTCKSSSCQSVTTITGYENVQQNDQDALQQAVAQQPVSVAVDAGGSAWQFYSGGIVTSACGTQLDHGVLAAGYGTGSDGTPYWLVKNSWGASWGEQGYIRLMRGSGSGAGECGIAMDPSYPTY